MNLFNSATLMTWFSLSAKLLNPLLLLPLVLTSYTTGEIALWFLLSIIASFQLVFDMGFSQTFIRAIAYSTSGNQTSKAGDNFNSVDSAWKYEKKYSVEINEVIATMHTIYFRIGIAAFLILGLFGSLVLAAPIADYADQPESWYAWLVVLVTTSISVWGGKYSALLQGVNKIALFRKWEAITSTVSILTSAIVVLNGYSLFTLIATSQLFVVIAVARNIMLCNQLKEINLSRIKSRIYKKIYNLVWPSAWRSGIGILAGFGTIQATGLLVAQFGAASEAASYMLALRLIQTVSQFSQAPFYTKIPTLAKLKAQGRINELVNTAETGMRYSYFSYLTGFFILALLTAPTLTYINSNIEYVGDIFWAILGVAIFLERYGAMHIQLYSVTNKIIWHIANGLTGILLTASIVLLYKFFGIYAFPISILVSNLLFYAWYSAMHSYREYNLKFFDFEKRVMLPPAAILILYLLLVFTPLLNYQN